MNCRFCEPNIAGRYIASNNSALAVLHNPRLVRGHALVIPKQHVEYPGDLSREALAECFELIEVLRAKLLKSGLAYGVDVRQHYRPFLPESRIKVNHIHFHVLPRTGNDELHQKSMKFEKNLFSELSNKEQQEISALLKSK